MDHHIGREKDHAAKAGAAPEFNRQSNNIRIHQRIHKIKSTCMKIFKKTADCSRKSSANENSEETE